MSYQVLARKWRPRIFKEMAGQEHVLKALINALDNDRLHHAYLFTGTRGVGKTTIARILAKCLNCERGVTSEPCGECGACAEINEGRFIDLIEVDAASRTKVDDTRELLDNVQYAPARGRYKVYLIDEVHMLSAHSFNALLKTLEEPPPHVKFLLATTDPQKLPVTVLSRCLQFNLKNLSQERISQYLTFVLGEEQISCDEGGVWALSRAADGSMRDALSLTDQAISHGGGEISEREVNAMLGTIDHRWVAELCSAVVAGDGAKALAVVDKLAEHGPDYSAVLSDMLGFWHRIAIAQTVPEALANHHGDQQQVAALAKQISREDVQLCYQIALLGKRDLPLAPDMRSGFEMTLLRQLAFKPGDSTLQPANQSAGDVSAKKPERDPSTELLNAQQMVPPSADNHPSEQAPPALQPVPAAPEVNREAASSRLDPIKEQVEREVSVHVEPSLDKAASSETPVCNIAELQNADRQSSGVLPPWEEEPQLDAPQKTLLDTEMVQPSAALPVSTPQVVDKKSVVDAQSTPQSQNKPNAEGLLSWVAVCQELCLTGMVGNTANNLVLIAQQGGQLHFQLDTNYSSLYEPGHQQRIALALSELYRQPYEVVIEVAVVSGETPRAYLERKRIERQASAVQAMRDDPLVNDLDTMMSGQLLEDTVQPID